MFSFIKDVHMLDFFFFNYLEFSKTFFFFLLIWQWINKFFTPTASEEKERPKPYSCPCSFIWKWHIGDFFSPTLSLLLLCSHFPWLFSLLSPISNSPPVSVSVYVYYIWTLPVSTGTNWLLNNMVWLLT